MRGGLWSHPDFLRLWAGQTVSVMGSLTTRLALPLLAIVTLRASAFEVALLAAADVLAGVLFGLVAGVVVDRLPRRPLMIAADLLRALILGSIPAAAAFGVLGMAQLYAAAFLAGVLTTFFDVAYTSYLPTLVRQQELVEGNAKLTASACLSQVLAFGLAGWLVERLTAPGAVAVDALSFLVSAASLLSIRKGEPPLPTRAQPARVSSEVAVGLRAVLADPLLRPLAASVVLLWLAMGMTSAVFMLFASRELGFSAGVLGLIFAVGGFSSFAGALVAGPCRRRLGPGRAMMLGLGLAGGGFLAAAGARGATPLAAALLVAQQILGDPGYAIFDVNQISLRQELAPAGVLGRVNAGVRFASFAAMLLGSLAAGAVAERAGSRPVLVLAALVIFSGVIALGLSPLARSARRPEPVPQA
jgi:MFS family permease